MKKAQPIRAKKTYSEENQNKYLLTDKKTSSGNHLISNTQVNLYWLKLKIPIVKQYTMKRNSS